MPHSYCVVRTDDRNIESHMPDEKKIIIDEDWKSRVEAEKEEAAKAQPASAKASATDVQDVGDIPMPPASLELLLTTLATESLIAMGQIPHPATGKIEVQRHQATYLIDLIDMLREKTKGNLNPGEQQLIESMLHQLRMVFVETIGQSAQQASNEVAS
jgi:hypothetical protein